MLSAYALAFCRMVIGMVFAWSLVGKVRDVRAFEQTITRFQVLPERWSRLAAGLVLGGEGAVVGAMGVGGVFLKWGFLLAASLLVVFCAALALVLRRQIHTSCRCFGATGKLVSGHDIVRNSGFIFCALGGCGVLVRTSVNVSPSWPEWALTGVIAGIFVAVWAQMREIVALFR
ncbi:MAG: MauE/DoxX family redox-associated membrane protein [Anaerolineales bacterium]